MIISKSQDANAHEKFASDSASEVDQIPQAKSKYHPFDDDLQYKFYMKLPDLSAHIIDEEE